ncbi:MAG TPA: bifunctional UDP-N-acetylglucosamine diphosphorylase/glucosamine-1-phosphate N-acetyltransferase GlmU [Clostridiaceae bacterium]
MYSCAIILAAGEGKRMKSTLPKVLHKICGKELVNHVIDTMRTAGISEVGLVVGKGAKLVKEATSSRQVDYFYQENQLGTGDAVKSARQFLEGKNGVVAIFTGDAPLIRKETMLSILDKHINEKNSGTILTSVMKDPGKYGRIIRDVQGNVEKIVEFKDCKGTEAEVKEINSGMYCFDIPALLDSLDKITNDNAQKEYYLTDCIGILKKKGLKIGAMSTEYEETLGVNSRLDLAEAEEVLRKRINISHMENGVTIIDPKATYIDSQVEIAADTIIYPGNFLQGRTIIGEGSVLYPNSRIENSTIGKKVVIQSSVIIDSKIGDGTTVGPYAYIRPESLIGENVKIGDFVEIKKSTIGNNTKVAHLTYIGDAEVGTGCNFGCGTVIVNYDGVKKHKTIIGDNSFIGCNTNLVAPVEVEANTYIAAGSTITKKVLKGSLSIARARQINIEGWVEKKGLLKK